MKNLIEAKITIMDKISIDLIFCWVLVSTIHLGKNPIKGGIPAKDRIKIEMVDIFFLSICWVSIDMFIFLKFIIIAIEITL